MWLARASVIVNPGRKQRRRGSFASAFLFVERCGRCLCGAAAVVVSSLGRRMIRAGTSGGYIGVLASARERAADGRVEGGKEEGALLAG